MPSANEQLHHSSSSAGSATTGCASTDSTARSFTRSTSNSYSPTVADRPAPAGAERRCDESANRRRVRVPLRVEQRGRIINRHRAGKPEMPVGKRLGTGSPDLNSSPTSPSSSESTSSSVSRPAVPPNSSTTSARCDRRSRNSRTHLVHRHAFVHARNGSQQAGERLVRAAAHAPAHQVLRMEHADDVVDRVAVDRQPRKRTLGDDGDDLGQRRVDVDGRNLPARHHQLLCLPQVKPKRALQPAVLVGFEQAAVAAFRDQQLDFVRRMDMPVRLRRGSDQPQQQEARAVEPLDERTVEPQRRQHRDERVERRLRRVLKRQRLRHKLGEDDLRHGQDEQDRRRRRRLRRDALQPAPLDEEGLSQTAMVRWANAPSTRLERVMPIWQAAM